MNAPRTTAIHEAGHAVMVARLNWLVNGVTTVADHEAGAPGSSTDDGNCDDRDDAEAYVLICVAGYAAVTAAGLPNPEVGCDDDFEKADDAITRWQMTPRAEWKARALDSMRKPENLRAIEVIASRLQHDGRIDGQLFAVLLSWADGDISARDLADYEAMAISVMA